MTVSVSEGSDLLLLVKHSTVTPLWAEWASEFNVCIPEAKHSPSSSFPEQISQFFCFVFWNKMRKQEICMPVWKTVKWHNLQKHLSSVGELLWLNSSFSLLGCQILTVFVKAAGVSHLSLPTCHLGMLVSYLNDQCNCSTCRVDVVKGYTLTQSSHPSILFRLSGAESQRQQPSHVL